MKVNLKQTINDIISEFNCTEIARLQKYNAGLTASDTFEKLFIFSEFFQEKRRKKTLTRRRAFIGKSKSGIRKGCMGRDKLVFNVSGIGEGREIGAIQLGKSTKVK